MSSRRSDYNTYLSEVRLFLEEICCDLCRFEHGDTAVGPASEIRIDREYYLGRANVFADIRVCPAGLLPYFVDVNFGYSTETLLDHMTVKYGPDSPGAADGCKVILAFDTERWPDWADLEREIRKRLRPGLGLEVWNERTLARLLRDRFGVEISSITEENLLDLRAAIDRAKGRHAFGDDSLAGHRNDSLKSQLVWHFGFWKLRELRERRQLKPRQILPPGNYQSVVVVMADLCSFSSYVRDTPDNEVIRESLTAFYSKARYQIINSGGMLYEIVGDEVTGLFGMLDDKVQALQQALETARALLHIGNSVSNHWQRRIDLIQESRGAHVGMALGDLQMVSLRPFSRTHMGGFGDSLNLASRLTQVAQSDEIVISNALYQQLDPLSKTGFTETEPIEARNIGRISAWRSRMND